MAFVGSSAWADNAALLRCRAMSDAAQRLQCYDGIVLAATPAAAATAAPVANPVTTPTPAQGRPVLVSTHAVLQAPRQQNVDNFDLAAQPKETQVQDIESRINAAFLGWRANDRLTLANGQVWQVVDDSVGVMNVSDPKVKIRRGAMGAYHLELDGTHRSPCVRRLQ